MHNRTISPTSSVEYAVIGAGPAGIAAVAKLYASGVAGAQILWIDPQFKVGDFGTKLSVGSSVPGNTAVESYQKVNGAIYSMIPACVPTREEENKFEITALSSGITCSLRVAAEPLQHITDKLRQLVCSVEAAVLAMRETKEGIQLDIQSINGTINCALAKRVILAVGAEPRTTPLPGGITKIDPNTAFVKSELEKYLAGKNITTVAVIGSSHSAALATMHLLQAGIAVKQFMNKEYKFATQAVAPDGTRYTQFDNTGLKGEVALFTRQLLDQKNHAKWDCYIGENVDALLAANLSECTHAVVCIGYAALSSLTIDDQPLADLKYNKYSTQITRADGRPIPGVFGVGVAFPLEVKALSGEVESAVGVGKFWASISDTILAEWKKNPAGLSAASYCGQLFRPPLKKREENTSAPLRAKL